jgi:hypothetical protein
MFRRAEPETPRDAECSIALRRAAQFRRPKLHGAALVVMLTSTRNETLADDGRRETRSAFPLVLD